MNRINLLEALNLIDDRLIEEAIDIDTPQKLRRVIAGEKTRKLKKTFLACAACLCLVVIGAIAFNSPQEQITDTQVGNPVVEVTSSAEMEESLGYDVPVIEEKEVASYIVIDDGENPKHGRIVYSDDTEFDMEEGQTDASGISGGTKEKTETICETAVDIYSYEDIAYGTWSDESCSYAYSAPESYEDLEKDIETIIENTKQGAESK